MLKWLKQHQPGIGLTPRECANAVIRTKKWESVSTILGGWLQSQQIAVDFLETSLQYAFIERREDIIASLTQTHNVPISQSEVMRAVLFGNSTTLDRLHRFGFRFTQEHLRNVSTWHVSAEFLTTLRGYVEAQ